MVSLQASRKLFKSCLLTAGAVALFALPAQALEKQLTVVTSFPKDLTTAFKTAFEKANPGVKVEMLKKKTTAGVKYIQETASNNSSDLF